MIGEKNYKSIAAGSFAQIIENRSKFLGFANRVLSFEEALYFINNIKHKYFDASHHVYAYSIYENNQTKYCDDSEPQGSAGFPILDVLKKEKIYDCIIVVVRYFGGILLGKSRLTNAYRSCAKAVINSSSIIFINYCFVLDLKCNYEIYKKVENLIVDFDGNIDETVFLQDVSIKFHIKKELYNKFLNYLLKISRGKLKPKIIGEGFLK
ncbi:MAG: YigZ family protein [Oscillospiraceae bacterium]|jgi:uncharacterized YigZ family protein|nr:YigZ family protein [Oscillospiraceae bacterium]